MARPGPRTVAALLAGGTWALALLAGAALAAKPRAPGREEALQHAERRHEVMGLTCAAAAEARDSSIAGRALDETLDSLALLGDAFSPDDPASELSRLNASGFENRVPCSDDLWGAIATALEVARETEGAFDPTVEPLVRAWDLRGAGRRPETADLMSARAAADWRAVQLHAALHTVRFSRPGAALDLDGVWAGQALDRAQEMLRARGVKRARLDLGDATLAFADEGSAWGVAVPSPLDPSRTAAWLTVRQGVVATLGPPVPGVVVGGVRYGRVVVARTGTPLAIGATVAVVGPGGARAAALATALMVMGREAAGRFLEDHRDVGVLWLEPDGGALRGWRWNLDSVRADPRVPLRWGE